MTELFIYVNNRPHAVIVRADEKTIAEIDALRAMLCDIFDTEQVEFCLRPIHPWDFTREGLSKHRIKKFEYPEIKPKKEV